MKLFALLKNFFIKSMEFQSTSVSHYDFAELKKYLFLSGKNLNILILLVFWA